MGIFDEANGDSDIISWRCGECGNNTAKKTGRWVDGDGTPANEYTCTRCGHIVWSTEKDFQDGLRDL
ncbi:hypothetical protein [Corynebacterium glutamicum]|uniref:hypothetical protein n=1 Tax=Corynebacterium glutamicum TaxID=1718 RepID=UPI0012DAD7EF|nr:hypothetical protein [Corynebacterium glutamicum]